MKRIIVAIVLFGGLAVVRAPAVMAQEVAVSGSAAMAHALILPNEEVIERQSGVPLSVRAVGSLRGLRSLLAGEVDIAMTSAPIDQLMAHLNRIDPDAVTAGALVSIELGRFQSKVIVHPSNPVRSISAEAMNAVLGGQITNWSQLGGPDQEIELIMQQEGGGLRYAIETYLATIDAELTRTSDVQTLIQVVRAVSVLPHSLGVTTAGTLDGSVFSVSSDLVIERPLYLVTKTRVDLSTERVIAAAQQVFGLANVSTWAAAEGPQ